MRTHTTTKTIETDGLLLTLKIEEDYNAQYSYPDDRIAAGGRVVEVVEVEILDEEEAYRKLAGLAPWSPASLRKAVATTKQRPASGEGV